jgi:hypothetical protein
MGAPAKEAVGLYSTAVEGRRVSPSLLASAPHGLGPRADTSEARRDNLTKPVTIPGARGRNTPSPPHTAQ